MSKGPNMSKDISDTSCSTLPDNCCSMAMEKLQFSGTKNVEKIDTCCNVNSCI